MSESQFRKGIKKKGKQVLTVPEKSIRLLSMLTLTQKTETRDERD